MGNAMAEIPDAGDPPDDDGEVFDEGRIFKWEIEPHPYNSSDFDTFVCDDDDQAREAVLAAAEGAWDQMEEGEEITIVIRRNKVTTDDADSAIHV